MKAGVKKVEIMGKGKEEILFKKERGFRTGKHTNLQKYFWVGSIKERKTSPGLFTEKETMVRLSLF